MRVAVLTISGVMRRDRADVVAFLLTGGRGKR